MRALNYILAVATALTLAVFAACDNNGCEENSSSLPLAGFYSSSSKRSISIDSLTVYGIGAPGDSAIIRNQTAVTQVYLPFDVDSDVSRFVIRYEQQSLAALSLTDTVTINYKSIPYFHSKDCGAFYVFEVTDYSTSQNLIDSIQIPIKRIDNTNKENIKIYFRSSEAGEE